MVLYLDVLGAKLTAMISDSQELIRAMRGYTPSHNQ